ncbi:hypothetical protein ACFYNZ_21355 [Streptomyces kebangsaanensis]|uniref:Type I restriction modification DNA specificity domain-containing protein n=1 Tax=Streptomyces kebangsaanensis TaxID=864058 RepID=A0ABW6KVT6_9ACTN
MNVESGDGSPEAPVRAEGVSELPEGWAWAIVGDLLVRSDAGKSFKCESRPAALNEWGIIKVSAMTWGEFRPDENKALLDEELVNQDYEINAGDILVSRANTVEHVGAPVLVGEVRPRLLLSDKSLRLKLGSAIDRKWFIHWLRSPAIRKAVAAKASGTSDSMRNISQSDLHAIALPVPPADEQRRITDALEERLARLVKIESRLRATQARLEALHEEVLDSSFRTVEESTMSLRDVLQEPLANGRSVPTSDGGDGCPVLRLTALTTDVVDLTQCKNGDWSAEDAEPFLVGEGDFLVCRGNGSLSLVGRGALVPEVHKPVAFPDTMIRVRTDSERVDPRYLHYVWASPSVRKQIERGARTGTGIYKVNQKLLNGLQLPFPPLDAQREIVDGIDRALVHVHACAKGVSDALTHCTALRRTLLAEAFAGRLIRQESDDEPAEDLLKRIRAEREAAEAERKAARRAAAQARRKSRAKPKTSELTDAPPPPAPTTDTSLPEGQQTTLPMEFTA